MKNEPPYWMPHLTIVDSAFFFLLFIYCAEEVMTSLQLNMTYGNPKNPYAPLFFELVLPTIRTAPEDATTVFVSQPQVVKCSYNAGEH